jgi:DNA polymerase-4
MPTYRARQLCPDGVFVPPRGSVYVEVSRQLMEILGRYSPDVEPLSLDEAFLDMSGSEALFGPPREAAERLLADIERELRLTASVGVAPNKYIAKVASDMNKPRGLTVCEPGEEKAFLAPLPIERLWGVGPKSAPKLHALGLRKIGDVARWDASDLERRFGSFGLHVWQLANGIDARRVEREREDKSMGGERTFDKDIRGADAVRERLLPLCDHVAARLRKHKMRAGGVRIKVKYATFKSLTRQKKLPAAVSDSESLRAVVEELMAKLDLDRPIRLVGLAAYGLVEDDGTQVGLFDGKTNKREQLEHVLDAVNAKFGRGAVGRAGAVKLGPGMPGRDGD